MVLFILRKLILQTRLRSHPVVLTVWFLVGSFVYFPYVMCANNERLWWDCAHAQALRAVSPDPSLVAYVISTIITWAGSHCVGWLIEVVFYGPSAHFMSFLARSVNLAILFLYKHSAHSFASNWQLSFLNQRKGDNGHRLIFMTKSQRQNMAGPGLEPATPWFAVRLASDCARRPGSQIVCVSSLFPENRNAISCMTISI